MTLLLSPIDALTAASSQARVDPERDPRILSSRSEPVSRHAFRDVPRGARVVASEQSFPGERAARFPQLAGSACLYDHAGFKGVYSCLSAGDHASLPVGWDNRATALVLSPGIVVDLFDESGLRGASTTVFSTESNLAQLSFAARASSMRIRTLGTPAAGEITSKADAARFLMTASYGADMAEVSRVARMGPEAWLNEQFRTAPRDSHWAYVVERKGPIGCNPCSARYINAPMESFWDQATQGPDQVRQRMVFALSQIFVVSTVNSAVEIQEDAHASYLDVLSRNAFGNFRTLLEDVTLHPTMGHYLSHFRNQKGDPATGRMPDENYAREVMQLFSIGLWELNPDGTRRKDGSGRDIPTYGQDDVIGLARVLTGWGWAGSATTEDFWQGWAGNAHGANWNRRMQLYPQYHSMEEKRFLGTVIPAGTDGQQSLRIALDRLFLHPNTAPFISEQLIKRFTSSNPSPAYVARVASVFADNGRGVRGDLQAVLRAVLLDGEARRPDRQQVATAGKLREPMLRLGQWLRAFNARSPSRIYDIWNLEDPVSSLGQNPLRAPSVFNWYRPHYAPPGEIKSRGMVAPEFQITHETTLTGYANFVTHLAERGVGSVQPNYSEAMALAGSPSQLVDHLNLLLVAGRLTGANRTLIIDAVTAVPASQAATRVHTTVALTMLTPEFLVQR